jgi:hypothetical protein
MPDFTVASPIIREIEDPGQMFEASALRGTETSEQPRKESKS